MENSFYIYIYNKYSKFIHKYNVQSSNKKWENFHCFCNSYFFKFKNFQFSVFNLKEFAISSIYIKLKKKFKFVKKKSKLIIDGCHCLYLRLQISSLSSLICSVKSINIIRNDWSRHISPITTWLSLIYYYQRQQVSC